MPSKIKLRPDDLRLVRAVLHTHVPDREVRAFGSRVHGNVKPMSDLDLCIMGDERVTPTVIDDLRTAFSESPLPIKVDLVEWATLQEGFRKIVETNSAVLQPVEGSAAF